MTFSQLTENSSAQNVMKKSRRQDLKDQEISQSELLLG